MNNPSVIEDHLSSISTSIVDLKKSYCQDIGERVAEKKECQYIINLFAHAQELFFEVERLKVKTRTVYDKMIP